MKTICIVHDGQESHLPRKHFLEMTGYRVLAYATGAACLEALERDRPDLVVLDILLEGRNGYEVCRELRTRASADELPIVLCSRIYRSSVFREEAHAAGAQAFLLLPMRLEEFAEAVGELLEGGTSAPREAAA
jgi:CheY-like chemotaxis protein